MSKVRKLPEKIDFQPNAEAEDVPIKVLGPKEKLAQDASKAYPREIVYGRADWGTEQAGDRTYPALTIRIPHGDDHVVPKRDVKVVFKPGETDVQTLGELLGDMDNNPKEYPVHGRQVKREDTGGYAVHPIRVEWHLSTDKAKKKVVDATVKTLSVITYPYETRGNRRLTPFYSAEGDFGSSMETIHGGEKPVIKIVKEPPLPEEMMPARPDDHSKLAGMGDQVKKSKMPSLEDLARGLGKAKRDAARARKSAEVLDRAQGMYPERVDVSIDDFSTGVIVKRPALALEIPDDTVKKDPALFPDKKVRVMFTDADSDQENLGKLIDELRGGGTVSIQVRWELAADKKGKKIKDAKVSELISHDGIVYSKGMRK